MKGIVHCSTDNADGAGGAGDVSVVVCVVVGAVVVFVVTVGVTAAVVTVVMVDGSRDDLSGGGVHGHVVLGAVLPLDLDVPGDGGAFVVELHGRDGAGCLGQRRRDGAAGVRPERLDSLQVGTLPVVVGVGAVAAVDTVVRSMLIGLPLLLVVVAGVTWLVTRRALRPVEAIRGELSAITGAGDLTRRVPEPASHDEVARLAATTNETLAALEASVEQQRRFVADASHELRSPIASLRTQLEVAAAHPELLDLDGTVADTVRLQHLAADLLLLARLDAGEQPQGSCITLDDLVREEVARRTDAHPVDVHIADHAQVQGSGGQLARVLGNLLDNAQRHATGAVSVTLRAEGGDAVLEVADDGPGVPPAERERIFERFVRLDDARSRDDGGAGLGLAIARDIVRRHGGDIAVRQSPGGGAVFQVRLPAAVP